MRATFFGLEIGKTGLTTAQFGLDVTGHNIANLDTEGYTRQRIVQTAYDPFAISIGRLAPMGAALIGSGTRVMILDQIRSAYLDRRFRDETTTHAYWNTRTQSLSYIMSFFDNVNEKTSINTSLNEFFKAMTTVSADAVSGAPRTLLQTAAMDLVQQLNSIYKGLIDFQEVENRAVETKAGDINRIAFGISELNKAIYTFELTGMVANDLRDKRNALVDELATLIDVEYREYPEFPDLPLPQKSPTLFEVKIAGEVLVNHDKWNEIAVGHVDNVLFDMDDEAKPRAVLYWVNMMAEGGFDSDGVTPLPGIRKPVRAPGETDVAFQARLDAFNADVSARLQADMNAAPPNHPQFIVDMNKVTGGEIKAHIDMRDGLGNGADTTKRGVPYYIEMMNDLARALVAEINAIHILGWTDHPNGSETGILFFNDGVHTTGKVPPGMTGEEYLTSIAGGINNITAKNITLSEMIVASGFNVAASDVQIVKYGEPEELQGGNNKNMLELYRIFSKTGITIDGREIGSFDEYATRIRFDVGSTVNTAQNAKETSRILTLAALNQRTAIAGVSLDEEMVSLVKYNHAYNGAARVITAMDDALDRLINGTGRVGL
jgi:flagellar hook-associated protein 1 FlgK